MSDQREISARIELTGAGGFVAATVDVTQNASDPGRILAEYIGRNVQELLLIALREHERVQAAATPAEAAPAH